VSPRRLDTPHHGWPACGREFLDRLRAIVRHKEDAEIRLAVAKGNAGSVIVDFARQSDLIVLGWSRCTSTRALRCVIRDLCPVIVFRVGS
jgi:hypothetical protein